MTNPLAHHQCLTCGTDLCRHQGKFCSLSCAAVGNPSVRSRHAAVAERVEEMLEMLDLGCTPREVLRQFGVTATTAAQNMRRHGRPVEAKLFERVRYQQDRDAKASA